MNDFFVYVMIYSSIVIFSMLSKHLQSLVYYILIMQTPIFALTITLSLPSLVGLPPFTGFLPKWLMIQIMMNNMTLPLFFFLFCLSDSLLMFTNFNHLYFIAKPYANIKHKVAVMLFHLLFFSLWLYFSTP